MNRLFRISGYAACFLAMFLASGGHWLVLQSVAWSRMLMAYSRTDSLSGALAKTFDGKHPCAMCRQIQTGRSQEEKQRPPLLKWERLPEVFLETHAVLVPRAPAASADAIGFARELAAEFIVTPPKPPPRAA